MLLKKIIDEEMRDFTALGGFLFYVLVVLVTLLLSHLSIALDLIIGFIIIAIIVIGIRTFYFKNRPKKESYQDYFEKIDASSFPSWHTARVFFLAFIFSAAVNQITITTIFFFIAFFTSISRIYLQKHDWKDVLGGFILAGFTYGITGML